MLEKIFLIKVTALKIVPYPHPTLRYKSKAVKRVDRELRGIVREMFESMYEARGIGLAANQVDLPLRLFVVNVAAEATSGEELVLINPVIASPKGTDEKEEGCLSIPGVHGFVARPEQIRVQAYDLSGNEIDMTVDGLLARAIQHEFDHIEGVLFIDRLSDSAKRLIEPELEEFQLEYQSMRETEKVAAKEKIMERLAEIEARYC